MYFTQGELLTKKEAASLLGIKPSTVTTWLRKGYLERAIRGNKWKVTLTSVREAAANDGMIRNMGPYYEANRKLVQYWVEQGGKSIEALFRKRASVDAESFDD